MTANNKSAGHQKPKLETDTPLSEKDEVKKAEHRMAKAQKGMEESVKADLKNRKK